MMEPKSEPKPNEEKKTWTQPIVEDYDLLSTTGSGTMGFVNDNLGYS